MSRRLLALFTALMLLLAACGDSGDDGDAVSQFQEVDQAIGESGSSDNGDTTTDARAVAPADEVATDDDMADSDTLRDRADGDDEAEFGFDSDTTALLVPDATEAPDFAQEDPAEPEDRLSAEATALFVGRQIIKTGEVVVEAADVRATTDAIIDTVFENGGAIWGQETESDPIPKAVLTIRVPPLDFDRLVAAVTRVPGVGVVSESTTSDDVTEVVVDLDARITAAESSVARVQQLLDDARDLNTIFQLEEELASRQANLERLLGQRKTIGDQVALSTIVLTVLELDPDRLDPAMEVVTWLGTEADEACPGQSSLDIGADDTAVLCVSINNTGEDTLTAIDVSSPTLRLRVDDFDVVEGVASLDEIEPGDELLLTVDLDADDGSINRVDVSGGMSISVEASATPATSESLELNGSDSVFLTADGDDPLPGFGDSFSGGLGAMLAVISILMIVVGGLLPFVPFIILAVWLGRKYMVRQRERADERAAYVEAYVAAQSQAQADAAVRAQAAAEAAKNPPPPPGTA